MRLINVRKGQFVYYKNELHKVYSVQPFFRRSIHLSRLKDLVQIIVTAKEITYYRPKHLDSFIYNGKRYTLDEDTRAVVGDYILVIAPRPDSLDNHHVRAIERDSNIKSKGVITNKSNGIKHSEYWVMTEGLLDNANIIDRLDQEIPEETAVDESTEQSYNAIVAPKVGQLYQKNDSD